jgi:hypothetical protein
MYNPSDSKKATLKSSDKPPERSPVWVGVPFVPSSSTSRAAAIAVRPKVPTQKERILAYMHALSDGRATRHQISNALEIPIASASARCKGLIDEGRLFRTADTQIGIFGCKVNVLSVHASDAVPPCTGVGDDN